jgi:hydrogenase maturation protease
MTIRHSIRTMTAHTFLIIGIGNTLRRDDGAGWVIASKLAESLGSTRLILVQQLAPELAMDLVAPEVAAVCFCDARLGAPVLSLQGVGDEATDPARVSHEISPATLLAYAAMLEPRLLPAWLVTIGGQDFDHGEGLSQPVQEGLARLPELANELAAEIAHLSLPIGLAD